MSVEKNAFPGRSSRTWNAITAPTDAPPDVQGVLFFAYAISAAVDWLYSGLPSRFPDLKICLSEGGIGWVAGLLDRLDHMLSYHSMYGTWERLGEKLTPAEVFTRNEDCCLAVGLFVEHKLGLFLAVHRKTVFIEQELAKACAFDGLEVLLRNNFVRVDVRCR